MKNQYRVGLVFCVILIVGLLGLNTAMAGDDMAGWGIDDPYNALYEARDVEKLKVRVTDIIEVVPMPGMSPGVALMVKEGDDDEEMTVHLCPVAYKKPNRIGLRKGDKITLRGYFAEIGGKEVIMAAKIKKEDGFVFKVRLTSDGTPFWTMSPGQLQKELSSD